MSKIKRTLHSFKIPPLPAIYKAWNNYIENCEDRPEAIRAFAKAMGVERPNIYRLVRVPKKGEGVNYTLHTLDLMCRFFDLNVIEVLEGREDVVHPWMPWLLKNLHYKDFAIEHAVLALNFDSISSKAGRISTVFGIIKAHQSHHACIRTLFDYRVDGFSVYNDPEYNPFDGLKTSFYGDEIILKYQSKGFNKGRAVGKSVNIKAVLKR